MSNSQRFKDKKPAAYLSLAFEGNFLPTGCICVFSLACTLLLQISEQNTTAVLSNVCKRCKWTHPYILAVIFFALLLFTSCETWFVENLDPWKKIVKMTKYNLKCRHLLATVLEHLRLGQQWIHEKGQASGPAAVTLEEMQHNYS